MPCLSLSFFTLIVSMTQKTRVQSLVESYQRLQKWPPCLTFSIIRYGSSVKWSNPGKGIVPSLHLVVVANEKEALGLPSTKITDFTLIVLAAYFIYFWFLMKHSSPYIFSCILHHLLFLMTTHWSHQYIATRKQYREEMKNIHSLKIQVLVLKKAFDGQNPTFNL